MGFKRRQLNCRDVKTILKSLGFKFDRQRGSHEQWKCFVEGELRLVTVDCPKAPFGDGLIKAMVRQSGYSIDEWYKQLDS